jgi:hypothetical protein
MTKPLTTTSSAEPTSATSTSFAAQHQPMRRSNAVQLINEALSRARMRSPQNRNSEAIRPARRIAIAVRHQQARELGNLSLYGVR